MAEICIKVPDDLKRQVDESDIDWSILVKRLLKHLEEEKEMTDWSVKLQRASRQGRFEKLRKRGLIK